MNRFLQILTLLVSVLLFNSAYANEAPETDWSEGIKPEIEKTVPPGPNPFFVQKPTLCQNGDAFITILELREEYRAFMGAGQLVKPDGEKTSVIIFTAVNFNNGTFTVFEWHSQYNMACILATGKGFQILEHGQETNSISMNLIKEL